jgi:hypothetical protein
MARRATLKRTTPKKRPSRLGGAKKPAGRFATGAEVLAGLEKYGTQPNPGVLPAAPKPTPQAPPIDPIYTEQLGLNQRGLDQTLADIGFQRGQIGQTYGFTEQGTLDISNPYNQAALLQKSYQQGQRGTTNSMAGRGQLYSGAHQRNLDEGTFQYGRSYDALRRQATNAYGQLTRAEQDARSGFGQGNLDALSDSLGRAQGQRPVDPGPVGPSAQDFANLGKIIAQQNKKPAAKKQKPGQQNWRYKRPKPTPTRIG